MHSPHKHDFQPAETKAGNEGNDTELSILREVLRLLPTGVTVQDEHGNFLLVNDAAAALLQMAAAAPTPSQLTDRHETCLELLRSGRAAVVEEAVTSGPARHVFLYCLPNEYNKMRRKYLIRLQDPQKPHNSKLNYFSTS